MNDTENKEIFDRKGQAYSLLHNEVKTVKHDQLGFVWSLGKSVYISFIQASAVYWCTTNGTKNEVSCGFGYIYWRNP